MFPYFAHFLREVVLLAAAVLPFNNGPPTKEVKRCDVVEINHFYNDKGELVFTQLICWWWNGERYEVASWRMLKDDTDLPRRMGKRWRTVYDVLEGRMVIVESDDCRETWTQYDPELLDRELTPQHKRRWP